MKILNKIKFKTEFKKIAITIVIASTSLLIIGCQANNNTKQKMPAFQTVDLQKTTWSDKKFSGKVGVVHFWATSCTSCIEEMPELIKGYQYLSKKYPNQFAMLAINMPYDPPAQVFSYQKITQLPFAMSLDLSGDLSKNFAAQATPTTIIFNQAGQRVKTIVGPMTADELVKMVEDIKI